jgi:hypothetical protein
MAGFLPYQQDPRKSQRKEKSRKEKRNNSDYLGRAMRSDWCECGECEAMPTDQECVCCHNGETISKVRGSAFCITDHASFEATVLNIDTLHAARSALLTYVMSGSAHLKEDSNRTWRFFAYKQFIYWVNSWASLGKNNRKVIPACVVLAIRRRFPEADGVYVGFSAATDHDTAYFD